MSLQEAESRSADSQITKDVGAYRSVLPPSNAPPPIASESTAEVPEEWDEADTDFAPHDVERLWNALEIPGRTVEMRCLGTSSRVVSGYFTELPALLRYARLWSGKSEGVYLTLNEVDPQLFSRAANRAKGWATATTGDSNILSRRLLLIDCDPVRPSGISTSDAEHSAALALAELIRAALTDAGWPLPLLADSGNGAHLLYRIDLSNDSESAVLLERCLKALSFRFSTAEVAVDEGTHNAARLCKLYGTLAMKGDSTPERPHRLSRILDAPDALEVVTVEQLQALAALAPEEPKPEARESGVRFSTGFDLEEWIIRHGLPVVSAGTWKGGRKWVLNPCPWNDAHTNRAAYLVQFASGAIAAGCHHNGCSERKWHDLRDLYEPGWRERHRACPPGVNGHHEPPFPPPDDVDLPPEPGGKSNIANNANFAKGLAAPEWETPIPFAAPSLPAFPVAVFPSWLSEFIRAEAVATQTPPDLASMLALSTLAASLAKKVEVQVTASWTEPVNLFTVTALRPAARKSAVFAELLRPLEEWEAAEGLRLAPQIASAQNRYKIVESRLQKAQTEAAKAAPQEREALERVAEELAQQLSGMTVPAAPRLLADDTSPERLQTLLRDQKGRMALMSPEGGVFDLMAGRYGQNGTPNFEVYLKGHAGDNLRVDRVNRPAEMIRRPALTLGLAVQPDVIRSLADQPGFRGRGLLGRFLYSLPPDMLGSRNVRAPGVPIHLRDGYWTRMTALLDLPLRTTEDGDAIPYTLQLTPEAEHRLLEFSERLEPKLAEFGELAAMTDWAGKLVGTVARIAALIHVAERAGEASPWEELVDVESVDCAIQVGDYLLPHAKAAYALMGADPEVERARYLLGVIHRHAVPEFSRRDLFEWTKGRFSRVEDLTTPLRVLIDHQHLRERAAPAGTGRGRPAGPVYEVNPASQNSQNSQKSAAVPTSANIANFASQETDSEQTRSEPGGLPARDEKEKL